jgi:hypothetical protein
LAAAFLGAAFFTVRFLGAAFFVTFFFVAMTPPRQLVGRRYPVLYVRTNNTRSLVYYNRF